MLGSWITTRSSCFIPKFSKPDAKRSTFYQAHYTLYAYFHLQLQFDPHIFQHALLTSRQMFLQANSLLLGNDLQILFGHFV